MTKPRLLFVSPRYLLPADMGGKIRTAHVLKGLKGGRFHVILMSPAPRKLPDGHAAELAELCDEYKSWPETERGPFFAYLRLCHLFSSLPIPVATDRSVAATQAIATALEGTDVVVTDFLHAAILLPPQLAQPSVLFTHNVEAEIFARHLEIARNSLHRFVWKDQLTKMQAFEAAVLKRADSIVAVSERDREVFRRDYGVESSTIPTGVDLEFFSYHPVKENPAPVLAFTASMDSLANIDGVRWLMEEVWPLILREIPEVHMRVIGRNPEPGLVADALRRGLSWTFTGYVDDVRPHLEGVVAYVIPLRVGGGTRIKAFEAMAFGLPTVSTSIGIEGLGVTPDRDFLQADTEEAFAAAVVKLLRDRTLQKRLSATARRLVEDNYSAHSVGRAFEEICVAAMDARAVSASPGRIPRRGTSAA